jgi:hypothetical protein
LCGLLEDAAARRGADSFFPIGNCALVQSSLARPRSDDQDRNDEMNVEIVDARIFSLALGGGKRSGAAPKCSEPVRSAPENGRASYRLEDSAASEGRIAPRDQISADS